MNQIKKGIPSMLLFTAALMSLTACSHVKQGTTIKPPDNYNAVVDGAFQGNNGDTVNGVRTFRTVQSAADSAPDGNPKPYIIYIKNGTYKEKLTIRKPHITLIGEDEAKTILTDDVTADQGGTAASASITVTSPYFTAENLSITNSFNYFANMAKADGDKTKVKNTQAVALATAGLSNHAEFLHVTLDGYQDNLYANMGTQYFEDCTIKGGVDFIFGAGQAVFNKCDIISKDRKSKSNNGFITAASTNPGSKYGFLIINSRLLKDNIAMAEGTVSLGRPWHPGSKPDVKPAVVYMNDFMDSHISAEGWTSMSGFSPMDARFYEYGSTGPGAHTSPTRRVLTQGQTGEYTIAKVLNGWDPATKQK